MIALILILILNQHFNFASSESLNDLSLQIPTGSWIINASLVDSENHEYTFNEIIYSGQYVEGKISISFSSEKWQIYYSTNNRNQRLVIYAGRCDVITYNEKWEQKLSGITNPLLNHILLVGPSITYRLAQGSLFWEDGFDAKMRGVTMHGKSTTIGGKGLNITNYYIKDPTESSTRHSIPSVTIFTGADPSEPNWSQDSITLHTYRVEKSAINTEGLVKPETGIGCPFYFAPVTSKPKLFSQSLSRLHYIVDVTEKSSQSKNTIIKNEEVYIDESTQQMSVETTIGDKRTQEKYDFTLGIKYKGKEYNSCPTVQLDLSVPGIIVDQDQGKMNILAHLGFNLNYKYVGIVQNNLTAGRDLHVWESVEYNKTLNGKKYNKLVTTQYLLLINGEQFLLHTTTINGYMKTKFDDRNILEVKRIYRKFEPEIESEDYERKFNVEECYPWNEYHRAMRLHFTCQGDCDHFKSQIFQLRYEIKLMITRTNQISASRISNIEVIPDSNGATAYITFLKEPEMKEVFPSKSINIRTGSLTSPSASFVAESRNECFNQVAKSKQNFQSIVYDYKTGKCLAFKNQDFPDKDDGKFYDLFRIPLKNLPRFGREVSLDEINSEIEWKKLSYRLVDETKTALYSCDHIENVASKTKSTFDSSYLDLDRLKMIPNGESIIQIDGVKNAGQCFTECFHTDKFDCRSISVCIGLDEPECMISNLTRNTLMDEDVTRNSSCKVLFRNAILDYVKVPDRKYKVSPTTVRVGYYAENCASLCYETNDCLSFQDCKKDCSLGGYYTDASTEFSSNCDIYIPKALHKFTDNGKRIVTDVIHIEIGLNLDQCAALCHDWLKNSNESCQSFNFCPSTKLTSSCELSKHTIADSKTLDSKICHNYGYPTSGVVKSQAQEIVQEEDSSAKIVIGSITIFVGIGFIFGFVLPIIYAKFRSLNHSRLSEE